MFLVCIFFTGLPLHAQVLTVRGNQFLLDGKPFRILSGEMHYPRIPEPYWKDRFQKARAMGLTTVCTYVFWNLHEPAPGEFHFEGNLDVARFIREAQDAGLHVILRPGPYVCSEWDFGGLPAWLLKDPEMRVRCMYPPFLEAARRFLIRLGKELDPLMASRGGPIMSVQVENEYGSYGNDRAYLRWLEQTLREAGFDVLLTTSDGPAISLLEAGTIDDVLPVVNFSDQPEKQFATLDAFRKNIPHMCGEYWTGWFTQWGQKDWGGQDLKRQSGDILWMLEHGKSLNMYMFHGGTNFGFIAGANFYDGRYFADVTSYDYGAPLTEDGRPGPSFQVYRKLLARFGSDRNGLPDLPRSIPAIAIDSIHFTGSASMFSQLGIPVQSAQPRPMEYYGQNLGYILYRTTLTGPKSGKLEVHEPHDYATVYLDGKFIGTLDRHRGESTLSIPSDSVVQPALEILVEALGRINFGPRLLDRKGITDYVALNGVTLMNWDVFTLPMDDDYLQHIDFSRSSAGYGPQFFRGSFELHDTGDTFLELRKWSKGFVVVNGHNLGRYWPAAGPQKDLYLPGCWLNKGENHILLFDLQRSTAAPLSSTPMRQQ